MPLKIWRAAVAGDVPAEPGEIVSVRGDGIVVGCGKGSLVLEMVQKSGGKKLSVAEFLSGHLLRTGDRFESRE
jgi:methionyl-tRNA formyltransferase